jgi:hypothetical protein
MTLIENTKTNLPANMDEEARKMMRETASANPRLIYKKGKFYVEDAEINLGRTYMAYPREWLRGWLKWGDGHPVDDTKLGRASEYDPPPREELGDLDKTKWDDPEQDPWQMQNILPLTDMETDELVLFCSGSWGGLKAIRKVVSAYYREVTKGSNRGNPIISLDTYERKTDFGMTPTPKFEIISWENADAPLPPIGEAMDDEIPH